MILHIGVKGLDSQLVAYKILKPGESEIGGVVELNAQLHTRGVKLREPTMIIHYDPKDTPNCRREVVIGIDREVEGVETKWLPETKVAFILFVGGNRSIDYFYNELVKYIESIGLKISNSFYSIEAIWPPEQYELSNGSFIEEDSQEIWKTEVLIPVEGYAF